MAIRTTVTSGIDVTGTDDMSISVNTHTNTGVTASSAPALLTVQAERTVSADQLAARVAASADDITAAGAARLLNAVREAVESLVDESDVPVNVDFGWGRFLFEIAGTTPTASAEPTAANYCYFTGSVGAAVQRAFAQVDAYVEVAANPCDLKRVRDAETSALNVIRGAARFYAEGRGFDWGEPTDRRELYRTDGTKVCDLVLDTAESFENCLALTVPARSLPVGEYVVRVDVTVAGKVWRMEKSVTNAVAIVPTAPTVTKVTQEGNPDDTIFAFDGVAWTIHGTELDVEAGDTVRCDLYEGGLKALTQDMTAKRTGGTATTCVMNGTGIAAGEQARWCADTAEVRLVVTRSGLSTEHVIHMVNA